MILLQKKIKKLSKKLKSGFTVIELVVVLGIIAIVTSIVLSSQSRFGGSVLLTNLAYDIAVTIRQAQSYGISVRQFAPASTSSTFDLGYGVHVRAANPSMFLIFADVRDDKKYDTRFDTGQACISDSECVRLFRIEQGNYIKKFCATRLADGVSECSDNGTRLTSLDITFKRPNPDAHFVTNINPDGSYRYKNATIFIANPAGVTREIHVARTGQIYVQ